MSMSRRIFFALTGAGALAASLRAQQGAWTLVPEAAGMTLKDPNGRVVFTYLTSKPAGIPLEGNSVCCIHPFNTPSGIAATDIAPPDHRDHRGIFLAWHDMSFTRNGATLRADFWGWGKFAPTEGRMIVNRDVRLARSDASSAEVAVTNDWMIEKERVLQEATTIRAATDQGARVLDLTFRLTPDYDMAINRVAFSGLCFRCRKDGEYAYEDSNGAISLPDSSPTEPDSDWPSRAWYGHTITHSDGRVVASALIDHPSNPPSRWHGVRLVSFLNPCVAALKPVNVKAKQSLTLRYRAVTQDGRFPAGVLDRTAAAWRKG
jgi:hypothetical protein